MVASARILGKPRWALAMHGPDSLVDDLGGVGCWVGLRSQEPKRQRGEKEDYVLRRLLTAWRVSNRVEPWPELIEASEDQSGAPDFILHMPKGNTLGVEVAGAGTPDSYARFEAAEQGRTPKPIHRPASAAPQAVVDRIADKVKKFLHPAQPRYRQVTDCDLAVYDETGNVTDVDFIRSAVRQAFQAGVPFRQVHFVRGDRVYVDFLRANEPPVDVSKTYEIDYAEWIFDQIERLRARNVGGIDAAHIAEELGDLGRAERHKVGSHLQNLLLHLLKWQFQPSKRTSSWRVSATNARIEIESAIEDSPSLDRIIQDEFAADHERSGIHYRRARLLASQETGLPLATFPEKCPYTADQVVDMEFLPEGQVL